MIAGWTQKPTLITESGSFYNLVFFFDEMKKREAITLSWQEVKKKTGWSSLRYVIQLFFIWRYLVTYFATLS